MKLVNFIKKTNIDVLETVLKKVDHNFIKISQRMY